MGILQFLGKIPGYFAFSEWLFVVRDEKLATIIGGLKFPNPVGLAAGFDKDAKAYNELGALGFGFVEIGTITPLPQDGNPRPRLFRLPADKALINRMGFNNDGIQTAVKRLTKKRRIIIGGNIGKNKNTANENAHLDYLTCFEALYPLVDYFVINISSPNTPGLRALQEKEPLMRLLDTIQAANRTKGIPKPLFLKIAPDLSFTQVDDIIEMTEKAGLTGLVISNTTISREGLKTDAVVVENLGAGGVSGRPVFERSTELVKYAASKMGKRFAIIASGGIFSARDALEKLDAGADLVQLYTGFIYEGPGLIREINKSILRRKNPLKEG